MQNKNCWIYSKHNSLLVQKPVRPCLARVYGPLSFLLIAGSISLTMNRHTYFLLLVPLALFFLLICTGCAPKKHPQPPHTVPALATVKGGDSLFRTGQIIDLQAGQAIAFSELIRRLRAKDLVFIGEVHDNAEHHLIQVQILQKLLDNEPGFAVGIEFLPHPVQPVLDRFMAWKIDEQELLEQTDWSGNWGFPFSFYRPLFHLIRKQGETLLALNAPNKLVKKVARTGLAGLTAQERDQLAKTINLEDQPHRAYLKAVFQGHAQGQLNNFDFFYQAQCAWEETMAERIAGYRQKHPVKMAVFCGNGHIVNKFGIPDRVHRRQATSLATLLLKPLHGSKVIDPQEADYVWLTRQ